jgi:hypothetical protein
MTATAEVAPYSKAAKRVEMSCAAQPKPADEQACARRGGERNTMLKGRCKRGEEGLREDVVSTSKQRHE